VVCMGKQSDSLMRRCDFGRAKSLSLSTRGSGHSFLVSRTRTRLGSLRIVLGGGFG
jgi:hypothetical protein